MPTFSPEALRHMAQVILEAAGAPADLAQVVGESLVESNLVGQDSHGVIRLMQYMAFVRPGLVQPTARLSLSSHNQATGRVGAARGWGQPAARLATQTTIALAQDYGVAEGKLPIAGAKGERVAPGLILDRDGQPSIEPADFYAGGALLPFGGHKGYGISVMIELVAGALSGMAPSVLPEHQDGNGTLIMALNIARFVPLAQFTAQADVLSPKIKATPTATGFSEGLVPGEPEMRTSRQRLAASIPVPEQTWQSIQALAGELQMTL